MRTLTKTFVGILPLGMDFLYYMLYDLYIYIMIQFLISFSVETVLLSKFELFSNSEIGFSLLFAFLMEALVEKKTKISTC